VLVWSMAVEFVGEVIVLLVVVVLVIVFITFWGCFID